MVQTTNEEKIKKIESRVKLLNNEIAQLQGQKDEKSIRRLQGNFEELTMIQNELKELKSKPLK